MPDALYSNDMDAQLEFWHTLASHKLTSNDEAFHGMLLYLDGQDPAKTYDERVAPAEIAPHAARQLQRPGERSGDARHALGADRAGAADQRRPADAPDRPHPALRPRASFSTWASIHPAAPIKYFPAPSS